MTTGTGSVSFGWDTAGENEEGRTLLVINAEGSQRQLRDAAYYTGQSMAVHVEHDSELGKEPPTLRTLALELSQPPAEPEGTGTYDPDVNVADEPSAIGRSSKLQIFLDSPDLYDKMLERVWDWTYVWGRSDAIHVRARNREEKPDPLPPILQDGEPESYMFESFGDDSTGGGAGNLIDHFDHSTTVRQAFGYDSVDVGASVDTFTITYPRKLSAGDYVLFAYTGGYDYTTGVYPVGPGENGLPAGFDSVSQQDLGGGEIPAQIGVYTATGSEGDTFIFEADNTLGSPFLNVYTAVIAGATGYGVYGVDIPSVPMKSWSIYQGGATAAGDSSITTYPTSPWSYYSKLELGVYVLGVARQESDDTDPTPSGNWSNTNGTGVEKVVGFSFSGSVPDNTLLVTPGPSETLAPWQGGNPWLQYFDGPQTTAYAESSNLRIPATIPRIDDESHHMYTDGSFYEYLLDYWQAGYNWGAWSTAWWSDGATTDGPDILVKWMYFGDSAEVIPSGFIWYLQLNLMAIPDGSTSDDDPAYLKIDFDVSNAPASSRAEYDILNDTYIFKGTVTPYHAYNWPTGSGTMPATLYKGTWYWTRCKVGLPRTVTSYGDPSDYRRFFGAPYNGTADLDDYTAIGYGLSYMKTWKYDDPEPTTSDSPFWWYYSSDTDGSYVHTTPPYEMQEQATGGWDIILATAWHPNVSTASYGDSVENYEHSNFVSVRPGSTAAKAAMRIDGLWAYDPALDGGGGIPCGADLGDLDSHLSDGAWWLGGNPWTAYVTPSGYDFTGMCEGKFKFVSSTPNASFSYWVDPADNQLPFTEDVWDVVLKYRLTTASVPTDTGERYLWITVAGTDVLKLYFGDTVNSEGIAVTGASTDTDTKSLGTDVWVWVRMRYDGTNVKARTWLDGEGELIDGWDVSAAVNASPDLATYGFRFEGKLGNNGGTEQTLEIEDIVVERPGYTENRTGYVPLFRPLVDDPELLLTVNVSLLEAGAMALDWQTAGEIQEWGGTLRENSGRTEAQMTLDGATIEDIRQAWLNWDEILRDQTGKTWADAKAKLSEGRAIIVIGDYSAIDAGLQMGPVQPHGIIVLPHVRHTAGEDKYMVGDPLGTDFVFWPATEIKAYAEAYGLSELGPSSPQGIVFANTRAYVAGGSGSYIWPVDGNITQEYGCTGYYFNGPRGSCDHWHDGIDIAAPVGTPVVAPQAGSIILHGFVTGGAFNVGILHEDGVYDLLGHLQEEYNVVSKGDKVTRGQVVGHVGTTGHTTGPHVHWELRTGGWSGETDFNPRDVTPGEP